MSNPPIFDGHNDTLTNIQRPERGQGRTFSERSEIGQIDLPRARIGGLAGGICAIYTPAPKDSPESDPYYGMTVTNDGYEVKVRAPIDHAYAREDTLNVLDLAEAIEDEGDGRVAITRTAGELADNFDNDVFSLSLIHI